jgi:hypothetical protein
MKNGELSVSKSSSDGKFRYIWFTAFWRNRVVIEILSADSPDASKDAPGVGKSNSPSSTLVESWEDAVINSPVKQYKDKSTSEPAEEAMDEDEEKEDSLPELEKTKTRKKANAEPANKIKKEHVNLVIIGHVGKFRA